jgi:hypothetical protein
VPRLRHLARPLVWAGLSTGLWAIGACAPSVYEKARDTWTRDTDEYENFVAVAFVRATLKTEELRRAYVEEYAQLFDMTPDQKAQMLAAELEEGDRQWVVMIALYVPEPQWNDLDPGRGKWAVRLENEAREYVLPEKVRKLPKRNPTYQRLYPYLKDHFVLWEARFPRLREAGEPLVRSGDRLDLVIAGAPAQVRLSWTAP